MSKRFICRGCDKRPIKNECIALVPNTATAGLVGCLFKGSKDDPPTKWDELPGEVVFDHTRARMADAIVGCSREVSDELFTTMVSEPEVFFGDDPSPSKIAEFISENSNNPDVLSALARVILTGLLK